jgi:hypothetical protein
MDGVSLVQTPWFECQIDVDHDAYGYVYMYMPSLDY